MININVCEIDGGYKIETEKEHDLFVEPNVYYRFLMDNKDEIDKILFFALYAFANIKDFKKLFDEKKDLFKLEYSNKLKLFLEENEINNIKKFLNGENINDFMLKLEKIKGEKTIILFSLDLIDFSGEEKTDNNERITENIEKLNEKNKEQPVIPSINDIINKNITVDIFFE